MIRRLRLAAALMRQHWHWLARGHDVFTCRATGFGTVAVECLTCRRVWYRVPFRAVLDADRKPFPP